MRLLLVAYLQGRCGVLDDRGRVIEAQFNGDHAQGFDTETPDGEHTEPQHAQPDDVVFERTGPGDELGVPHRRSVWNWIGPIIGLVITTLFIVWLTWNAWRLGGWVGHALLGVPGVLGNVTGGAGCVLAIAILLILGNRLKLARRDVRSRKGRRSLEDQTGLFYSVDQHQMCGACGFSIRGFQPKDDGCVVCSECGAAWNRDLWKDFLRTDRSGLLKGMRKKQRLRSCMLDRRRQMMQVLTSHASEERDTRVRACKARVVLWDSFLLALILLILLSGTVGILAIIININPNTGGLIALLIAEGVCITTLALAVAGGRRNYRRRKLQRLVRDLIDERLCPSCEGSIDQPPHPVDGALVCIECGLAWDPQTQKKSHHSHKHVPPERFKTDSIFLAL